MSEVKGLLVMDVDSTLVRKKLLIVGEEAGVGQKVYRFMRGELDFRRP